MATPTRQQMHAMLAISQDLDDCIIKQPELYSHVADAHVAAIAQRDAAKLELEELEAEQALIIRDKWARSKDRLTEAQLDQRLKTLPKIQAATREYLELKAEAEKWQALKESYTQRSYMLRELVSMYLSRLTTVSSVSMAKMGIADRNRMLAGEERMMRRKLAKGT